MPNVPVVTQRSIAPRDPITPYVTPANRGGKAVPNAIVGLGQSISAIGDAMLQIKEEDDRREHKKLDIEYSDFLRTLGYGDGTEQNRGYLATQGENAIKNYGDVLKAIEDKRKELMERAPNDAVRRRFEVSAAERTNTEQTRYLSHIEKQREVAADAVSVARVDDARADAAANYDSQRHLDRSLVIGELEVREVARRKGLPSEAADQEVEKIKAAIVEDTFIAALKHQDIEKAEDILNTHGAMVKGQQRADLVERLTKSRNLRASQAETDKIIANHATLDKRLAAARSIKDPNVRAAVEEAVKTRTREENEVFNQGVNTATKSATEWIEKGGTLQDYANQAPEAYAFIEQDKASLDVLRALQSAKQEGRLFANTTDGVTAFKLESLTQEKLAVMTEEEVLRYRPMLTKDEWTNFYNDVGAAKDALNPKSQSYAVQQRAETVLRRLAPKALQFGKTDVDEGVKNQQNRAINQIYRYVDSQIKTGRVPSHDEIVAEVNRMFLPIRNAGWRWNGWFISDPEFVFQLEGMSVDDKREFKVPIDKVAPEIKDELRIKLRNVGIPDASDELLENILGAEIVGDRGRQLELINKARTGGR